MSKKFFIITSAMALALILSGCQLLAPKEEQAPAPLPAADTTGAPLVVGTDAIAVSSNGGVTTTVTFVQLQKAGFVVIHEDSDGEPGQIIGSSNVIRAGTSSGIAIITKELTPGATYYAILHSDNGDGIFNAALDAPVKDKQGNIVML